jgi:hypothetical protein
MKKSRKDALPARDLSAVLALIAGSAIVTVPVAEPSFSNWEELRNSADVDALVLAWIASHVRGPLHRGRLN